MFKNKPQSATEFTPLLRFEREHLIKSITIGLPLLEDPRLSQKRQQKQAAEDENSSHSRWEQHLQYALTQQKRKYYKTLVPHLISVAVLTFEEEDSIVVEIFKSNKQPLFIKINDAIIPTIHTLESHESLLPTVHVTGAVMRRLLHPEHSEELMCSDIFRGCPIDTRAKKDCLVRIRCISLADTGDLVAVGVLNVDLVGVYEPCKMEEGLAVTVIHHSGDEICLLAEDVEEMEGGKDENTRLGGEGDREGVGKEATGILSEEKLDENSKLEGEEDSKEIHEQEGEQEVGDENRKLEGEGGSKEACLQAGEQEVGDTKEEDIENRKVEEVVGVVLEEKNEM